MKVEEKVESSKQTDGGPSLAQGELVPPYTPLLETQKAAEIAIEQKNGLDGEREVAPDHAGRPLN